jgi:hypothetical protein
MMHCMEIKFILKCFNTFRPEVNTYSPPLFIMSLMARGLGGGADILEA